MVGMESGKLAFCNLAGVKELMSFCIYDADDMSASSGYNCVLELSIKLDLCDFVGAVDVDFFEIVDHFIIVLNKIR